ncbi:MAG TPA: hypothetical protein VIU38_10385 [Anaerolineales bacterium]
MDSPAYTPSRWTLLITALPVLLAGACIAVFGLNMPFVDQFRFIPTLAKAQQGGLTFFDLFAQINEHRPIIPRLIWLGLAAVSRYDVRWELWADLLIAAGTFALLAVQVVRLWRQAGVAVPSMLLALMSLMAFNLAQWESWLQGFQTVMYAGTACMVIGLLGLARWQTWSGFALALLLGVIGTFSTANDLLYWPIGLVVILMTAPAAGRLWRAFAWIGIGAACFVAFFWGWRSTPGSDPAILTTEFLPRLEWVANFLGAPVVSIPNLALPFGLLSILLFALITWRVGRLQMWSAAAPYLGIAAFVIATAVMISMGRLRLGMVYAVTPRYLTITAWYWVALLALLPILPVPRIPQRIFYSLLAVVLLWHTAWGAFNARAMHARMLPAYEAALAGEPMTDEVLQGIAQSWQYDDARTWLKYLADNRLSAYANAR